MKEKLDELLKLNEKFYELFGRLYENKKFLTDLKAFQLFGEKIITQYKAEYEVLRIKFETIEKPELYRAQVRHYGLVPRKRFFVFRNRSRKLIDSEICVELKRYFEKREKALNKLIEGLDELDSADNETTAFEEPESVSTSDNKTDKETVSDKSTGSDPTKEKQVAGQVSIEEITTGES